MYKKETRKCKRDKREFDFDTYGTCIKENCVVKLQLLIVIDLNYSYV